MDEKPKSIKEAVERYHKLPAKKTEPVIRTDYTGFEDEKTRKGPGVIEQALMWYKGVIDKALNWRPTPYDGPTSIQEAVDRYNKLPYKK